MMTQDSFIELIKHLDDLVAIFEEHPDPATREQAVALLSGLDALHREGLKRLMDTLHEFGGNALLDQVAADPVTGIMLGLYDLADLGLAEEPPPKQEAGFVSIQDVGMLGDNGK